MRIAIDAMGGDYAPDEIVRGVIEAVPAFNSDDELILVGDTALIEAKIKSLKADPAAVRIVHAPEVIAMDEPPVDSIRKKRKSSIVVMARLASHKQVDAVLSAGNTGACVAASQMWMRTLEGVVRPGIAVVLPTFGGPVTMCDVGANIACRPINLYQYAVMARLYSNEMLGIENPRLGLMSIGQEDAKGNEIVKKARDLMRSDPKLNFVGNVEGREVLSGVCDVVICEGFVGNVVLKLTEGIVEGLFKVIKQEMLKKKNILLAWRFKSIMTDIYKKYDYHEYGGALLLGVKGTSVICHGSSKARTIKNALLACRKFYGLNINRKIEEYLSQSTVRPNGE